MNRVPIRLLAAFGIFALLTLVSLSTDGDPALVIGQFSTRFLGIFIEAAPFLLLGTLTSGLIESFVTRDDLVRFVPKNRLLSTVMGALLGFAFPVCECGVVPVARRLFSKGLPLSVGVAFLLASPVINPIVLLSTLTAFGFGPILVGRFGITLVVAVGVGLVFALSARPQDVLHAPALVPIGGESGEAIPLYVRTPRRSLRAGLQDALRNAADEFFEMGRYLIIGALLAAGMQTFVPQDTLLSLGRGPVVSVAAMQALAFVLSVCSTVDAFLALAFVGTFTPGSILAFLTFGPMVDIKSTLMFLSVFRRRTVLYLILLPLLMTMLIAVWLNLNVAF
jgi:uncharacterized membrane protein YraQ (UPF0718 family)